MNNQQANAPNVNAPGPQNAANQHFVININTDTNEIIQIINNLNR